MKFNPIKRILYTDNGEVIKKLECPYKVSFTEPVLHTVMGDHVCDICNRQIVDTNGMNEEEILQLTRTSTDLCLKIDPAQSNVRIVYMR